MSLHFVPTSDLLNEILEFGDLTESQVSELLGCFSDLDDRIEPPDTLLALALDIVKDIDVARSLVEQIISINQYSRQLNLDVREFLDTEIREYARTLEIDQKVAERLDSALKRLASLAELIVFKRTSKAIELSYDCDNLLQRTRIMTDVRPLFTDDADGIDGAVVSHTLRLNFDSAGNVREMSLAMDDNDLRKLISDCERALTKADTARRKMCLPSSIPTWETEGENNGN